MNNYILYHFLFLFVIFIVFLKTFLLAILLHHFPFLHFFHMEFLTEIFSMDRIIIFYQYLGILFFILLFSFFYLWDRQKILQK